MLLVQPVDDPRDDVPAHLQHLLQPAAVFRGQDFLGVGGRNGHDAAGGLQAQRQGEFPAPPGQARVAAGGQAEVIEGSFGAGAHEWQVVDAQDGADILEEGVGLFF